MMIKIAKSSSSFDDSFFLDALGMSDDDDDEAEADETDDEPITLDGKVAPRSGQYPRPLDRLTAGGEPILRWSHEHDAVELDLVVPGGARAKELLCEVSKDGRMRVERNGESLLSGKLALPVDRTELCWVLEEQDDGSKLLCIELPMLPIDTSSRLTAVDCIFDESLVIQGQPAMVPGLSGVGGKA